MNTVKHFFNRYFWQYPHRLNALKVTLSIVLSLILAILLDKFYIGATLALGIVAMALSETTAYYKHRIKTSFISIVSFAIASFFVGTLHPYPWLFGLFLVGSTFFLLLLGGINTRFQKVTFGILLLTVYAILGIENKFLWYEQPLLLSAGALLYSVISIGLLYFYPWRVLQEMISTGYSKLAIYVSIKSTLFPSGKQQQDNIRIQLAQANIDLSKQIDNIKFELDTLKNTPSAEVLQYYRKWELLQELHTRFASSHERYEVLSNIEFPELIEGFGQLIRELGFAIEHYAQTLLSLEPYQHPISLRWTTVALSQLIDKNKNNSQYIALSLLLKNLLEIEALLKSIDTPLAYEDSNDFTDKTSNNVSLKSLLNLNNARFRFSVRLTLCYLVAYLLILHFDISKAGWLWMTCLIISQQTYSATQQRLFNRILGTLLGVILGVFLNFILPTKTGQIVLLLGSIFAFFCWVQTRYTWAVIFITTYVLAIFNLQSHQGLSILLPRVIDTLIAALLVFTATRFLWPDWQYKRLPYLLKNSIKCNKVYFCELFDGVSANTFSKKRKAHQADNELSSAWKNMLSEPKRKRWFLKNAYNLSYLNHAFLSYVLAFDMQKLYKNLTPEEKLLCKEINRILSDTTQLIENTHNDDEIHHRIEHYQKWEKQLFELKVNSQNPKIILIHNIARVALAILQETQQLFEKKGLSFLRNHR